MVKTAFLYPGQGSQVAGMGISVAERYPEAVSVFERASELAGYDVRSLCSEGPMEKLSQTRYTQPSLFTVEAAITDVLKARDVHPECAAGHSLGEFGAWYTAGVYSFEDGFRLVSERGRIMDSVDPGGMGTMCAVIGLSGDVVEQTCQSVDGTVVVANINSPVQMVISGEREAVETAGNILKEKGAKRIIPLKVSGAFHSPLMENAREEFEGVVENITVSDARIPVYANVTAAPVTDADEIREVMVQQLTLPVRWIDIIKTMVNDGVSDAFEVGPGSVLAGLVKRINGSLDVSSMSDSSDIMEVLLGKN
ncbi:ACP S-malonyltransferase [Candidatus Latescibacterota bacterium]